jgi:hypothetical protein
MKNQYFGDINDYRKYGVLRILTGGQINTAACWMLTPNDGGRDGGRIGYLSQPEKWRQHDEDLFDHLKWCVLDRGVRHISEIENSDLLPWCTFLSDIVPDDGEGRVAYFQQLMDLAQGCDLVFFDPDNGVEVKSRPYGRKGSCKYLYWHEIGDLWNAGHSLLIYQHFPHVKRAPFIQAKAQQLMAKTGAPETISFRTSHVVFFLVPKAEHADYFNCRSEVVARSWCEQILVAYHRACAPGREAPG